MNLSRDNLIGQQITFDSGPLEVLSVLHKTSSSNILLGKDLQSNQFVIKHIPFYMSHFQEMYYREFTNLCIVGNHPNILNLLEKTISQGATQYGAIKFEYCQKGNLYDLMQNHDLNEDQILFILKELLSAVIKLQDSGIVHRDINPSNILVTDSYGFKLGDFGSSLRLEEAKASPGQVVLGNVEKYTHPVFRPPDFGPDFDLGKIDIWGVGCTLYFMIFREMPFSTEEAVRRDVSLSMQLQEILNLCLEPNPAERPAPRAVLSKLTNWKIPSSLDLSSPSPEKIEFKKLRSSISFCLNKSLEANDKCPDLYYLHHVLLSAWNKPETVMKFYNKLKDTNKTLTVTCVKLLILLHRYLISGPSEVLTTEPGPKAILESLLSLWTNKEKDPIDQYHCDYFCGLVRQMCRVLLDKLEIHQKTSSLGNWKMALQPQHLRDTMEYLRKIVRICDGLLIGVNNLSHLMNFLIMQLVEECQRLSMLMETTFKPIAGQCPNEYRYFTELSAKISNLASTQAERSLQPPPSDQKGKFYSQQGKVMMTHRSPSPLHSRGEVKPVKPMHNMRYQSPMRDNLPSPQLKAPSDGINELMGIDAKPEDSNMPPMMPTPIWQPASNSVVESRWLLTRDDLQLGKILGSGASCTVYKGKYKRTPVAIKMMRDTFMGQSLKKEFEREVTAMMRLRHPNLVMFMGACAEPQMIIVSEFCGGETLFKLLHEKKNIMLTWKQKLKMMKDVARGMFYLHDNNPPILHRDLKSLNLLLLDEVTSPNDKIMVKITDFGVARAMDESGKMTGQMGTCHWMAPEVINNQPYTLAADIYSFAIVMWEIVVRETPYRDINPVTIPMRVVKGERPNLSVIPSTCPDIVKDIIRASWDPIPSKRPNFAQILDALDSLDPDL